MEQSDLNLLENVPPYHLQALVKSRHVLLLQKEKNADTLAEPSSMAVSEIAQALFDPSSSSEAISSLNEVEGRILRELVACGGRGNSRDLALYLSLIGATHSADTEHPRPNSALSLLPLQYPTAHPHGVFELALHRLLLLGLVFWGKQTNFTGRDYANGVYDGVLIVPHAVMETMKEVASEKQIAQEQNGEASRLPQGYTPTLDGGGRLQRMLYLYWSLVSTQRDGLPIVNSRLLARPALRQVVEQLTPGKGPLQPIRSEAEFPHLLFIRLLLMKLGLLYERNGALQAASANAFFARSTLERMRLCYRLWLETPFWDELAYLPEVIVRPGPTTLDPAHEEVVHSRQVVIERMLQEQPGEWHELSAFIARTKLYAPYLLFPRQFGSRTERYSMGSNPYGWDFRLRRGWLTHREGWHLVEGGFIRTVLAGPLHWLGLLEVNNEENPSAFRFSASMFLVTAEDAPLVEEMPPGRLIVQPNFELVALAPVSEALLVNLDRFAERLSLEHIAQYRLTKASVARAIQSGQHANTISQVLEQAAGGEIPQNVQYSLTEWERQARRIELWRDVTLLEVDTAALLDALFADEKMRPMLGRRLAPLLAEVASNQLDAVQEALWQHKYLPALTATPAYDNLIESGRFPALEPQWKLLEDGLLQPSYAVLNLYLVAEMEQITEFDEATNWQRITASSIQKACSSGLPLDHIVRFLQNYCEGGVSPAFLIRLKLWGGGYGDQHTIRVENAPLLSLSTQVLQDVQADDELGPLLGAEVTDENRLIHIVPDQLERVMALLRERGFVVE